MSQGDTKGQTSGENGPGESRLLHQQHVREREVLRLSGGLLVELRSDRAFGLLLADELLEIRDDELHKLFEICKEKEIVSE